MNVSDLSNFLNRVLTPFKIKLALMINRAAIALSNDTTDVQQLQVSALAGEDLEKIESYAHFGFTSNPPLDTEAIMVSIGGNRENSVIIATENRQFRIKNLARGECAIYTDDGTFIKLKKSGQIHVKTATRVLVEAPLGEFTGNVKVNGTLQVVQKATFNNDIQVDQNAKVTGIAAVGGITGLAAGPVTSTVDFNTSGNVSGGGTSLATIKSTFNGHTHPETGTTTGAPDQSL